MELLVDIGHPAHVHFFKHAIWKWERQEHRVLVTARDKDIALYLLDAYGIPYIRTARARGTLWGLLWELLERDVGMLNLVRRQHPDVLTGIGGTIVAHAGALTGTPSVIFSDTEHARLANAITFPFATAICTPSCYEAAVGPKQVTYSGYQELAYLHPDYFTPDRSILTRFGVAQDECYIIVRLVSWTSAHDVTDSGVRNLRQLVDILQQYGRVLITSEKPLPPDLESCRFTIGAEYVHHLLAFASLYIGESATMASESAMLGTPAIFVSTSTRGYTNEQERKYDLVYTFSDPIRDQEQALAKAEAILCDPDSKAKWRAKRDRMLANKIDVTQFIVDVVERYGLEHQRRSRRDG